MIKQFGSDLEHVWTVRCVGLWRHLSARIRSCDSETTVADLEQNRIFTPQIYPKYIQKSLPTKKVVYILQVIILELSVNSKVCLFRTAAANS